MVKRILLNVPALFINLDFSLNHKFKATTQQTVSPQSLLAKKNSRQANSKICENAKGKNTQNNLKEKLSHKKYHISTIIYYQCIIIKIL